MPATIVMGGQWGDEGKGKLTDALAGAAGMVVRANGGSNAGHTVATDQGVFKLHLVPSGILNPECTCVIGAGVVIDPAALLDEMDGLRLRGIDLSRLRISDRAHVVLPFHPMLDRLEEAQRADDEIGTTLRGNGPAYADKVARRGIRMTDLLDRPSLERRLSHEISEKNRILTRVYNEEPLDSATVLHRLTELGERLRDHIVPAELLVQDILADGGDVVIECAQGAMLDVDYGIYPFVTSSSPTAAGACQAAGVAPTQVSRVIGVFKAYSTRVGSGPLPTELHDADGQTIRERGNEYGTTTGRPRRTGWFDAVTARYVARLNGLTEVALTLLDVLDPFEEINICTSYKLNQIALDAPTTDSRRSRSEPGYRVQQNEIDYPPARAELWDRISPVYNTVAGWQHDTTGARVAADLPPNAHAYIQSLERAFGTRVTLVGVGPNREQLVPLDEQSAMAATAAATGESVMSGSPTPGEEVTQ